jgi:hypothetical protein
MGWDICRFTLSRGRWKEVSGARRLARKQARLKDASPQVWWKAQHTLFLCSFSVSSVGCFVRLQVAQVESAMSSARGITTAQEAHDHIQSSLQATPVLTAFYGSMAWRLANFTVGCFMFVLFCLCDGCRWFLVFGFWVNQLLMIDRSVCNMQAYRAKQSAIATIVNTMLNKWAPNGGCVVIGYGSARWSPSAPGRIAQSCNATFTDCALHPQVASPAPSSSSTTP